MPQNSLSGVGGNVLKAVFLSNFDLIAGGNINLTSGREYGGARLGRARHPDPSPRASAGSDDHDHVDIDHSVSYNDHDVERSWSAGVVTPFGTNTTTSTSSDTTLEAGQSATVTSPYGTTATYVSNGAGPDAELDSGQFTSAGNIVEPLPAGQPPQTVPPAPPGVIFKVNHIDGNATGAVNLLTDSKIFGYDPTTGQVVRFDLNLNNDTATVDPTFTPISVPGDPPTRG